MYIWARTIQYEIVNDNRICIERSGRRGGFWRMKPKTKPCGLGFGWKCRGGVREGQGGLCGVGDSQVSGLGGRGAGARERGQFGARKLKTEPCGLGFGFGTCRGRVGRDQGVVWCGGWPSEWARGAGGRFGVQNQKPSPMGSVSAGHAGEGWGRDQGDYMVQGMAE